MKTPEEILEYLKEKLGSDSVIEVTNKPTQPVLVANPLRIHDVLGAIREEAGFAFKVLTLVTGVDNADGEKKKSEDGSIDYIGGTLSVYYHMQSVETLQKLLIMVSTPRENPVVESVTAIHTCADWQEREIFDLYGIQFLNHPDLRRIMMPYDWEYGYPLRKDYRNPEFYRGMRVPY